MMAGRCPRCSSPFYCMAPCACETCGWNPEDKPETEDDGDHEVSAEAEPQKMPSVFKQVANFAKSTFNHVASGAHKVPDHVYKSRLEICNSCDKLHKSKCSECGCFVSMKASWASEKCPLEKWMEYKQTKGKCGGCGGK